MQMCAAHLHIINIKFKPILRFIYSKCFRAVYTSTADAVHDIVLLFVQLEL